MTMALRSITYPLILLQFLSCNAQTEHIPAGTYGIDPSIKTAVDKSIKKDGNMVLGHMDIKMFEDDKEIHNTFNTDKKIPFLTRTNIYGDIISISGFSGMFAGFGFILNIRGDSCEIFFNIATDAPNVYKLNATDTTYTSGLLVPTTSSKVILSEKPNIKALTKFKPLDGYVEFESREYYEKSNGKDKRFKIAIKTYFRTDEIE
jgi:hypothetical protein